MNSPQRRVKNCNLLNRYLCKLAGMLAYLRPAPLPTGMAEVAEQGKASPIDSLADWAGAARSSGKSLRALLAVLDLAVLDSGAVRAACGCAKPRRNYRIETSDSHHHRPS
ncbi:unnamed protein product [Prorocentrum cordatum]|uniref:Uncharacterized protein n=1 Tax=Prorocentrum cordatum TaxID=2364126 RepID=A0ABN9WK25_9DINO|nr:unnamed protein product [Polarella glacialis]